MSLDTISAIPQMYNTKKKKKKLLVFGITYIWVQNRMVVLKVSYCTCVQLDLRKSLFDCLIKPLVYCLTGILSRTKF